MRGTIAMLVLSFGAAANAGDEAARATAWLDLVDAARYTEAWDQAAPALRSGTDRAAWSERIRRERRSDGKVVCRKLITVERSGDPPRVFALFASEFDDGHRVGEKVTLSADAAAVLAYRIGPPAPDRGAPCSTSTTPEPLR